ncbi:MAG: pectic acid lyase, partial [Armatimonadetes bacterium]|nr:pectic acid lyase [Armatimonadota bacterium]
EGEVAATPTQVWVQPPGTPSVGEVLLRLHQATGEARYLEAAVAAGEGLAWGQLSTGGWDYVIDFDPTAAQKWHFLRDVAAGDAEPGKRRRVSTLDDDVTQAALRFLMQLDQRLEQKNEAIHQAVVKGLEALLGAQYPNGAWPQRFDRPADPSLPVKRAQYPAEWSRVFPKTTYLGYYTLNDDAHPDAIRTMLLAHRLYGDERYLAAARRGGEFLIAAQMPEPQPAWAQQYNHDMEPAWARKFEPPAISAGESAGAIAVLYELWVATGDEAFRQPIGPAVRWFRDSVLPDGQWARFYELRTNRPLYFVKDTYELTYDGGNVPTHYAFKGNWGKSVLANAERYLTRPREEVIAERNRVRTPAQAEAESRRLAPQVRTVIGALDGTGRWVKNGWIEVGTAVRNLDLLARWLQAAEEARPSPAG